jgi:glycyl-tRNA synthetase
VNFDSLNDQAVTVRERDSVQQVRIGIGALEGNLAERLAAADCPRPRSSVAALPRCSSRGTYLP